MKTHTHNNVQRLSLLPIITTLPVEKERKKESLETRKVQTLYAGDSPLSLLECIVDSSLGDGGTDGLDPLVSLFL